MKKLLWTMLLIGLSMCVGFALSQWTYLKPQPGAATMSAGTLLEQVELLSELVTTRVQVNDVVETTIRGHLGGRRALIVVKGEILLGVDLSQATFEQIDQRQNTATLHLPAPHVTTARLDHTRTRIVHLTAEGTWHIVPGDAGRTATINRALLDAEDHIARAATEATIHAQARRHAEQALTEFFAREGWDLRVRWNQ